MGTKTRQEIARQRKYKKMEQQGSDTWSAKMPAYRGTSVESSGSDTKEKRKPGF